MIPDFEFDHPFGELGSRLNNFSLILIGLLAIMYTGAPSFYVLSISMMYKDMTRGGQLSFFAFKFYSILVVSCLILLLNTLIYFRDLIKINFKWTPKADLALTYVLASIITAVITSSFIVTTNYHLLALPVGIIISLQARFYFMSVVVIKNDKRISERKLIEENCHNFIHVFCLGIITLSAIFLFGATLCTYDSIISKGESREMMESIVSLSLIMIFYIVNIIPNKIIQNRFEGLGEKTNFFTPLLAILIIIELIGMLVYEKKLDLSSLIGLILIMSIVHGALYFAQIHRYYSIQEEKNQREEQDRRSREEREQRQQFDAKQKLQQDKVESLGKDLDELSNIIIRRCSDPKTHPEENILKDFLELKKDYELWHNRIIPHHGDVLIRLISEYNDIRNLL